MMISYLILAVGNMLIMVWSAWHQNWMMFTGSTMMAVAATRQTIRKIHSKDSA